MKHDGVKVDVSPGCTLRAMSVNLHRCIIQFGLGDVRQISEVGFGATRQSREITEAIRCKR